MPISAHTISLLVTVLRPVVWSCRWLTHSLKPEKAEPTVTRAELEMLARLGHQEGTIAAGESRVVRNLLRLDSVRVKHILTPRTVVYSLPASRSAREALDSGPLVFSRIPVFERGPEQISGYVLRYDIVEAAAAGRGSTPLHELARPIRTVPSMTTVAQLLEELVRWREHIVVGVDEYGGMDGIVTLEDAIECLLGIEITDESDPATSMQELARQRAEGRRRRPTPPGLSSQIVR
jgi:CBS domain containing-hemolysin-like protein